MKLFYQEYGSGNPLLILHGLLGMSDNWASLGKRFAQYFHVIIPDLRNHGRSPHSAEFSYSSMTKDVLELIQDSNFEKISMIGHSMGGRVAIQLCCDHPELFNRSIIVDIGTGKLPPNKIIQQLLIVMDKMDPGSFASFAEADQYLRDKIPSELLKNFLLKNLKKKASGSLCWKLNIDAISNNMGSIMSPLEFKEPCNTPFLFIKGSLSDYLEKERFREIQDILPNAKLAEIQQAGHWVHADQPELFFNLCRDYFLA